MTLRDSVLAALASVSRVDDTDEGVRVTTHCVYPSNGFVQVVVSGGPTAYRVSDAGGAMRDIESAGVEVQQDPAKSLDKRVRLLGLSFHEGVIYAPIVTPEALGVAIALVANASKDSADWFYDTARIHRRRNFKLMVRQLLKKTFEPDQVAATAIQGASSKTHHFDSVITLGDGKMLTVDAVVLDGNSINSAIATNVDVRERRDPNIIQRIVYDDDDPWTSADLSLLSLAGHLVAYSHSHDAFAKFTRMEQR